MFTKTRKLVWMAALVAVLPLVFSSCNDKMEEYFEVPDNMGGSIYEELSDEGNYSIFLKGCDRVGYTRILQGKNILTVMAPDDNAMTEYLQANYGTADIMQIPEDECNKLIGFHVLYYSFDKNMLSNFRPVEGASATEEQKMKNAGMYYKFRTHSKDANTVMTDSTGKSYTVAHNELLLPIFSQQMFTTKAIDAKKNYEYFYPQTGWHGDGGFNVANAAVTEYAKTSRSGYIYKVDRVLKPLKTIYQEMQERGCFSRMLALYDEKEYFKYDEELTLQSQGKDSLFHHYHESPLVNIDAEWGGATNSSDMASLSMQAYSMFAPTDEAFDNFFNDYWKYGGYESLDSVDSSNLLEIMRNSVYSKSIAMPEEIANGKIESISKEIISFDVDAVPQENRVICTNGVLYGCSVLTPPAKYRSVAGPAYQYKKFNIFQMMINNSGMSNTLTQDAVRYIMLFPDDEQFKKQVSYVVEDGKIIDPTNQNNAVSSATQTNYVNAHVVTPIDGNSVLPTSGKAVYATLSSNNKIYWYMKDGKLTNSILYNSLLDKTVREDSIWAEVEPLTYRGDANGWTNGHAYSYKSLPSIDPEGKKILLPGDYENILDKTFQGLMVKRQNDSSTEFYGFISLMRKAGLSNTSGVISFITDNCLMFIPTTEALETAIVAGSIPGVQNNGATVGAEDFFSNIEVTDAKALQKYMEKYFVPLTTASFTNYPYLGWGENTSLTGGLQTLAQEQATIDGVPSIISDNLNIYDDGTSLYITTIDRNTKVESQRVKVSGKYDFFPFIFTDGPVHFVEGCF